MVTRQTGKEAIKKLIASEKIVVYRLIELAGNKSIITKNPKITLQPGQSVQLKPTAAGVLL